MTEEWMPNAGDDVAVKLLRVTKGRGYFVDYCGFPFAVPLSALKPVPVAMTKAQAALIEIAIETAHGWKVGVEGSSPAMATILKATSAVLAERAPPDPVDAFLDEAQRVYHGNSGDTRESLRAVLEAFVAAGGGKS